MADIKKTFVSTDSPTGARNGAGFYPCQGLYVAPADEQPKVALIATHYNVDFSERYAQGGLPILHYGMFCYRYG